MLKVIDNLIAVSGWSVSDATKIALTTNDHTDCIAGSQTKSLMVQFIGDCSGAYAQKTFTAIDVTGYDEIIISLYSARYTYQGVDYNDRDDFNYKISFNDTMQDYYIPVYSSLTQVRMSLNGITSINKIKITANKNLSDDYLIMSYCVAVKYQMPLDIFSSVKSIIQTKITEKVGSSYGISVGTTSGTTGQNYIYISGNKDYIEKYAVITITDGAKSETHQINENTESRYTFTSLYDGFTLKNTYSSASVYISFAVEYGVEQKEVIIPGIVIDGMTPRAVLSNNRVETELQSYKNDRTVLELSRPQIYDWEIIINLNARHKELMAIMSECVRKVIANNILWVNGQKYDIIFGNDPQYIDVIEGWNMIPKMVYSAIVQVKEYYNAPKTLPNTTTINHTLTIENN